MSAAIYAIFSGAQSRRDKNANGGCKDTCWESVRVEKKRVGCLRGDDFSRIAHALLFADDFVTKCQVLWGIRNSYRCKSIGLRARSLYTTSLCMGFNGMPDKDQQLLYQCYRCNRDRYTGAQL